MSDNRFSSEPLPKDRLLKSKGSKIPQSRFSRMARLGGTATQIAGNVVKERTKQWLKGESSSLQDLLLTPGNIQKLTDQLAHLRGAAMKLGQLISMDSGTLLPEELTLIMERLRDNAKPMPLGQVGQILTEQWPNGWQDNFQQFNFTPIAAASIGQVHQATLKTGEQLAIKLQYPGVAKSIDSDVDNVATLLKISGLIPREFELDDLLIEAKKQLHTEADYQLEASHINSYQSLLKHQDDYRVPDVYQDYSSDSILVMSFEQGEKLESITEQKTANRVITLLFKLLFNEMFE
ncbi:MAG: AarF/ABC1/UbiB kinase family protein, partial [Kangiellaceae bacterium]|nr:AarF/ABC1/UbiB kinase family protein [Kangiellaceae bacterium]